MIAYENNSQNKQRILVNQVGLTSERLILIFKVTIIMKNVFSLEIIKWVLLYRFSCNLIQAI